MTNEVGYVEALSRCPVSQSQEMSVTACLRSSSLMKKPPQQETSGHRTV
jgi:hypothetical protein